MGKMSVFTILLFVTGIVTNARADEVISIDLNNYGNTAAYSGEAAVAGATTWIAFYGGWGVPAGSPRTANLAMAQQHNPEAEPPDPYPQSTYAAQVWVGDAGNHDYVTGAGTGLLDDGFIKNTSGDPNLTFIGVDGFANTGTDVYGGTFDLYVYGDSAGSFYLTDANGITLAGPLSITGTTTGFVEGQNYVVFEDVSIADPNSVLLKYSNELNAIQLVKRQAAKAIIPNSTDPNDYTITSTEWFAAHDTNGRPDETDYGFGSYFGPDWFGTWVAILDTGDWMEYDISIDSAAQGQYNLTISMDTTYGATTLDLFLDGIAIGELAGSAAAPEIVGPLSLNLFEGVHTLKWQSRGYYGGNIGDIVLDFQGAITLTDCADVYTYGLQPAGDLTGDCRVNLEDLALVFAEWAADYNPYAQ